MWFVTTLLSGNSEAPPGTAFFPTRDDGTDLVVWMDAVEEDVGFDGETVPEAEGGGGVRDEAFETGIAAEYEGFAFAEGHSFGVDGAKVCFWLCGRGGMILGEEGEGAEEFRF